MAMIQGRLQLDQTESGPNLQLQESINYIEGMMEEAHQNVLSAEIASAGRNGRPINIGIAKIKDFEEAGRRLG